MQQPLQITFRNMDSSPSLEAQIRRRADELEQFFGRITGCRVMVEAQHRHHHQGRLFHIRIDLTLPGSEIVVSRDPAEHHAHEDAHVAVADAFDAARRQIEDKARRMHGQTKQHEEASVGTVSSLIAEAGYGFLITAEGDEVYFHRNSVASGGFNRLAVGDKVHFVVHPGEGEKGPQASSVTLLGGRRDEG
jgi:cold shock CspA family protein